MESARYEPDANQGWERLPGQSCHLLAVIVTFVLAVTERITSFLVFMSKPLPKFFVAMCFAGLSLGAAQAVTLDFVTVGDAGNANDATGYGGVGYDYQIGTYEVTLLQYTAFLNAVAQTDTYGLYNSSMGTAATIAGIAQANSPGSFVYSVIGDGSRPVAFVNWFDAARFTNWLHHGQPVGLQMAGTTEDGAYTLGGAISGVAFSKSLGAQYWLPSENEWYKAAYFQPTAAGGDVDGYWQYPMQTNSAPFSDQPPGATPDNTRVGNFSTTTAWRTASTMGMPFILEATR